MAEYSVGIPQNKQLKNITLLDESDEYFYNRLESVMSLIFVLPKELFGHRGGISLVQGCHYVVK